MIEEADHSGRSKRHDCIHSDGDALVFTEDPVAGSGDTWPAVRPASYHRVAIVLHWAMAVGVCAQIMLGFWMVGIPKAPPGERAYWFNVHKSIGITLGLLALARLLWRAANAAPALPLSVPRGQRTAARCSHAALYLCMIIMPLSGYLGSSFTKYPIKYFGYTLPHWGWESPMLKELMSQVHNVTAMLFVALIIIHVAAALKHLLIARDGVFNRMWP
jgi:cytochrome b561